jgi:hypothetical protein
MSATFLLNNRLQTEVWQYHYKVNRSTKRGVKQNQGARAHETKFHVLWPLGFAFVRR